MHDSAGHITPVLNNVSGSICSKMERCKWQKRTMSIDAEVKGKFARRERIY